MDRAAEADKIIKEYKEKRNEIQRQIAELNSKELRFFRAMLEKLASLDRKDSCSAPFRGEFVGALD